ncbi:MAG TPA: mevalonate kinase [Polyangiales bacterium]|nr:mevalonate kinase [Polyangiales bacterium]
MAAEGIGHGKIILLGEHSVVYGRPALAVAIARGCRASAEPAAESSLLVEPWGVRVFAHRPETEERSENLREAFRRVSEHYAQPLAVVARMEIPGGAGLGGSAAMSVAVIRACDAAVGVSRNDAEILEISLEWERVFHAYPSGVDSAMATRGGVALYRKGEPMSMVAALPGVVLAVAHSGEERQASTTISSVKRQHDANPTKLNMVFDAIGELVERGRAALERGELADLGYCMNRNQALLSALLVSTAKLEELCQRARDAGALGAKLTGAGGGGCMIALGRDRAHASELAVLLGPDSFVVEVT